MEKTLKSSSPLGDCVVIGGNAMSVILNEVKNLTQSVILNAVKDLESSFAFAQDKLRLKPQNDIATQSQKWGRED
jgi:hypothetical protein